MKILVIFFSVNRNTSANWRDYYINLICEHKVTFIPKLCVVKERPTFFLIIPKFSSKVFQLLPLSFKEHTVKKQEQKMCITFRFLTDRVCSLWRKVGRIVEMEITMKYLFININYCLPFLFSKPIFLSSLVMTSTKSWYRVKTTTSVSSTMIKMILKIYHQLFSSSYYTTLHPTKY